MNHRLEAKRLSEAEKERQNQIAAQVAKRAEKAQVAKEQAALAPCADEVALARLKHHVNWETRTKGAGDGQSTDAMLMGFVRAAGGDVYKALQQWERWVDWRADFQPNILEAAYSNGVTTHNDAFVTKRREKSKQEIVRQEARPWHREKYKRGKEHAKAAEAAEIKFEQMRADNKKKRDKQFDDSLDASAARRDAWKAIEDKAKDRPGSSAAALRQEVEETMLISEKTILPPWRKRPITRPVTVSNGNSRTNSSRRGSIDVLSKPQRRLSIQEQPPTVALPRSYLNRIAQ